MLSLLVCVSLHAVHLTLDHFSAAILQISPTRRTDHIFLLSLDSKPF